MDCLKNAPGYEAVREGVVEGPPSAETVDAVLEAISKVSGKTFGLQHIVHVY